jgi:perosamine synthetase
LFQNEIQNLAGVWQKYNEELCPVSEFLQKRLIQFKTNYWNIEDAVEQTQILKSTINQFK